MTTKPVRFIDLFAGIGGFHLALASLGARCVFAAEIDRHAQATYRANFGDGAPLAGDITAVDAAAIPDFDILCAGFPCQPFSQAGHKRGFAEQKDHRGNMFFEIIRILRAKQPAAYFLENVRHLCQHDNGRTFATVQALLRAEGYSFAAQIIKASDHGLPQHRPRVFMVGFRDPDAAARFAFPPPQPLSMTMSDVFGGTCSRQIGYTLRVGGRASGLHDRRNWDAYCVDGITRRLSVREGARMMGFPDTFVFPVSERQAMKQLGNGVAVSAVAATACCVLKALRVA